MKNFADKLTSAQETYRDALDALAQARKDFEQSSGNALAEAIKTQDDLRAKIAVSEQTIRGLESSFQAAFNASGFEQTGEVKKLLRAKSEEEEVIQALRAALVDSEAKNFELDAQASGDAEKYRSLYMGTYRAWVRVQVFEFMMKHGEEVGRLLALAGHIGTMPEAGPNGYRYYDSSQLERLAVGDNEEIARQRQSFIMDAFKECGKNHPISEEQTFPTEMGELDLGPYKNRKIMTPAQRSMMRAQIEQQAKAISRAA